ncbi:MAG: M23 family metallopeptidase [Methylacidiphilales bacterium]|nr:M23 family metallopeptidase [Candidatus Methylacidiphilales bacterium]
MRYWVVLCGALSWGLGLGESEKLITIAQGQVGFIPLPENARTATYYDKRVTVVSDNNGSTAILGVPLNNKPVVEELRLFDAEDQPLSSIKFQVIEKNYGIDYLTITNKRFADPTDEDLIRAKKEQELIFSIISKWEDGMPAIRLSLPAEGKKSGQYGTRRVINRVERSPHKGLDIANVEGTQLYAPADSTVVYAGDMFYTGNTVILAHGQSLYTLYGHLQSIEVQENAIIKKGQLFGTMGMTGRVTGSHVHISLYLNQVSVDPLLLFK